MIVGFNHNINYKGVGFHVQTEDSGVNNPHLITLLYHGGTIIASQKTLYKDILQVENLSQVVEELAKEQHKGMLRRLTQGEFDKKIVALGIPLDGGTAAPAAASEPEKPAQGAAEESVAPAKDAAANAAEPTAAEPVAPVEQERVAEPEPVKVVEEPVVDKFRESKEKAKAKQEPSLEDLIFAYLTSADES